MKPNNKKLIAEIIPAIKLQRNVTQIFSYVVPDKFEKKIEIGMLVEIFFRNKKIIGVVYNLKKEELEKTSYKLKNIENLLDKSVGLSEEQMKLAEYVSNYYYTPVSLIIKTMIPPITKKSARKKIELRAFSRSEQACLFPIKRLDEKNTVINKLLKEIKKKNKILLIHNLQEERHSLYFNIIKNTLKKNEQTLILFPKSFDIYNFANFYLDKFGKNKVAVLTSELTNNQYFDEWKKIKNESAQIVIGTRQAVFAPFGNLKLIIADDEHSSSYKHWDMNPRYHGIKIAEKLAKIWQAKIILSSPTPSVESYYKIKNKVDICHCEKPAVCSQIVDDKAIPELNSSCIASGLLRLRTHNDKNINLIDINAERQKGNYSVLSEDLKDSLLKNIYERKQAIIFIPRLGNNTITQCKDCGWIAECENCQAALVSYANYLYCPRCQEKINLIKKCMRCQGQNINSFGCGSEKIEREIKDLFQNKNIKVARLDSETANNKSRQFKIYKDFIIGKIDILIGTQMVLKNWSLENLSILAIMFPEIIFNQPDFRSKEKSFQFLNSISQMANEEMRIIIQTNNIENPIYELLKNKSKNDFYKYEIEERKSIQKIGYPPFSQLIKLTYKDQNLKNCEDEANSMSRILQKKISGDKNLKTNFEITKPFPASNFREYGKYRYNIIIKSTCKDIESRNSLLNCIIKNWIIDIDPESVL